MDELLYDIEDSELVMPNGQTLYVKHGQLEIAYDIQRPERDVGIFHSWADWDLASRFVPVIATDEDGEREIALVLPAKHPAIQRILAADADYIHEKCMNDASDYDGPDPDDWRDRMIDRELMERS